MNTKESFTKTYVPLFLNVIQSINTDYNWLSYLITFNNKDINLMMSPSHSEGKCQFIYMMGFMDPLKRFLLVLKRNKY